MVVILRNLIPFFILLIGLQRDSFAKRISYETQSVNEVNSAILTGVCVDSEKHLATIYRLRQVNDIIDKLDISEANFKALLSQANSDKAREKLIDILSKRPNSKFYDLFVKIVNLNLKNFDGLSDDVLANIGGYSDDLLKKLDGDLPKIKNGLNANSSLIKAWEKLNDITHLRKDLDILKSFSKILDNHPSFMQAYGDKVKNIIEKLGEAGAKCNSCPPNTQNLVKPYMKSIDQHLDDLEYMISKYSNTDGFTGTNSLINEMASSGPKGDGAAFLMDYLRKNPTEFEGLSKFEFRYDDDLLNRADILVNTVKFEMKSWSFGGPTWNAFFNGTSNSYQQFITYLQNTTNISDLKYVFNSAKATESQVKTAFKGLFSNPAKKQEIFDAMTPQLRESFLGNGNANRFDLFELKLNDINSELYSFIKI